MLTPDFLLQFRTILIQLLNTVDDELIRQERIEERTILPGEVRREIRRKKRRYPEGARPVNGY